MAVSLSTNPTYPIPGRDCQVTVTAAAATNLVKLFCVAAPEDSELRKRLDADDVTRIAVFSDDPAEEWTFRPDKGGIYSFDAEEYTVGATTHGGAYQDDPDSYQSETLTGTSTSLTVIVANRMTAQIGVQPDFATLVFYVHDSTIRQTFVNVHGLATPAILEPATDRARVAANSSSVTTELAGLPDVTAAAALDVASNIIDDLIVQYEAHRITVDPAVVHANNDTDNTIAASFRVPGSPAGVARSANELLTKLTRHMNNDNDGAGLGTASYHSPGGNDRADQANAIIAHAANEKDPLSQCILLADLWRAYEAHRIDTTYHNVADGVNEADDLPPILKVMMQFIAALQDSSPAVPDVDNPGAVLLVHSGGFAT